MTSVLPDCPIWVGEFDLLAPPPRLLIQRTALGEPFGAAYVLLRAGSEPLGMALFDLVDGEINIDEVKQAAYERIGTEALAAHEASSLTGRDAITFPTPAISVVIGTHRRPERVAACVAEVLKQDYPAPFEVIVVENGVGGDETERAVLDQFGSDDRVSYVGERRPGLSLARNIGLNLARHPVTAFLSDDILVDATWLQAVARGFGRSSDVRCVLGYCPAVYLETKNQRTFERMMSWSTAYGFEPFLASSLQSTDPLYPYRVGMCNGSNMAFNTEVFRQLGGFNESLGPGTPARGGEDIDAPIRVLVEGFDVAYEPAALGWHADRLDTGQFAQRMYTYGIGLTAFLASHLFDQRTRPPLLSRIPRGLKYVLLPSMDRARRQITAAVPLRYRLANGVGRLVGPVLLLRSRAQLRSQGRATTSAKS